MNRDAIIIFYNVDQNKLSPEIHIKDHGSKAIEWIKRVEVLTYKQTKNPGYICAQFMILCPPVVTGKGGTFLKNIEHKIKVIPSHFVENGTWYRSFFDREIPDNTTLYIVDTVDFSISAFGSDVHTETEKEIRNEESC